MTPSTPNFVVGSADNFLALSGFDELITVPMVPQTGWLFNYNLNSEIGETTLTGSGGASWSAGHAVLTTGAAINSSAAMRTPRVVRYVPGISIVARFTALFTTGVAGSTQIIGNGNDVDGLFFGYNGTSFGILRRYNGNDTWVAQTDWSLDNCTWLDQTKGNVYQIVYPFLGYGDIRFSIKDPATAKFSTVHIIAIANQQTTTSILNPSLPMYAKTTNTTNNTAVILRTPSAMAFLAGDSQDANHPLDLRRAFSSVVTGVTTEKPILAIRSASTYQSVANRLETQVTFVSATCDGTKATTFKVYTGGTVTGGVYSDYDLNVSSLASNTTGTSYAGGKLEMAFTLGKAGQNDIDLLPFGIFVQAGSQVVITATSSLTTDIDVAMAVEEKF